MRLSPFLLFFASGATAVAQFSLTCPDHKPPMFSDAAAPTSNAIDSAQDGCSVQGVAPPHAMPKEKEAEAAQNQAKNNFCAHGTPKAVKMRDFASWQTAVTTKHLVIAKEPPVDRGALQGLGEGRQVQFLGYVFEARQEGKESVNCGAGVPDAPASYDIHIALLETKRKTDPSDETPAGKAAAGREECGGIVAEMSPHHRIAAWNPENVNAVGDLGLRVRITGQQFFDASHVPCSKGNPVPSQPKRRSLWEIHPIYSFEVCPSGTCDAGGWQPIEQFCADGKCPPPAHKKKSGD